MAQIERQWTDKSGHHWEIADKDAKGAVHSIVLTRTPLGWPDLDKARAEITGSVARANISAPRKE